MEFNVWIERHGTQPQYKGLRGATLKAGPQVCKTVHIAKFGPADSDEVSKTELRFKTSPRSQIGPGYDFDSPSSQWACENDEIETLLAFLHSDVERAGRYRVVDTASPIAEVLDALEAGSWAGEQLAEFVRRSDASSLGTALTTTSAGLAAAETAVLLRRRELIERAQQAAEDRSSNETTMQVARRRGAQDLRVGSPLRVALGAGPHGVDHGDDAAGTLGRLVPRSLHQRQP